MEIRRVVVLALASLAWPLSASAQFEGVIVLSMHRDGRAAQEVTQQVKGTMVRMDLPADAGGVSMIMNGVDGTMTSIVHAQKMYMTMNAKALAEQFQALAGGGTDGKASAVPTFTKTGRAETIAGYACEHYLVDTPDAQDMDVCMAKGLGTFTLGAGGGPLGMGKNPMSMLPPGYERLAAEFKDGAYPLKLELVEGNKRTPVMTVKSIEKKPLDEGLFKVPAGYKEFQMPVMPRR